MNAPSLTDEESLCAQRQPMRDATRFESTMFEELEVKPGRDLQLRGPKGLQEPRNRRRISLCALNAHT